MAASAALVLFTIDLDRSGFGGNWPIVTHGFILSRLELFGVVFNYLWLAGSGRYRNLILQPELNSACPNAISG